MKKLIFPSIMIFGVIILIYGTIQTLTESNIEKQMNSDEEFNKLSFYFEEYEYKQYGVYVAYLQFIEEEGQGKTFSHIKYGLQSHRYKVNPSDDNFFKMNEYHVEYLYGPFYEK